MKRMLVLSLVFHGLLFLTLVLSSFIWPRRHFIPLIYPVELVSLSQERLEQPKLMAEQRPKPVEQRTKREPLQIKKETKAVKPVERSPIKKEIPVVEKTPIAKGPQASQPAQPKEGKQEMASLPGVPDIMPVLSKPYTEYKDYHARLVGVITGRWRPPPTNLADQKMKAVVAFRLSRLGKIEGGVILEESSGNDFYDQAALRATMGPLPPPPPGYPEELLKMRLIYVLDQSHVN